MHPRCFFPFQAIHAALELSEQCGTWSSLQISKPFSSLRTPRDEGRAPRPRFVTFSSHVELAFCFEDENFNMTKYDVTHSTLNEWPTNTKPWALRPRPHDVISCHYPEQSQAASGGSFEPQFEQITPNLNPAQNEWLQQPQHVHDLGHAMQEYAEINENGQRTIEILTWFLHGRDHLENHRPRLIRLDEDFQTWTTTSRDAWRDLIQVCLPTFYFVLNLPLQVMSNKLHNSIVVQNPRPFECATVFSTIYHSVTGIAVQRHARFVPDHLHKQPCLDTTSTDCRHIRLEADIGSSKPSDSCTRRCSHQHQRAPGF